MAKHQVFLVHGMGNFEQDWSLGIKKLLRDSFQAYKDVASQGRVDDFDFVEILYDTEFEEWRQQWKKDAAAAAAAATQLGLDHGVATKLVDLAKSPSGGSFFQTHVLDVVMYRYLTPVAQAVSQSVRKQILERLKSFPQNDTASWSVIAHSLGTAVMHDTLHAMFTQAVDGVLLGSAFRPWYVFMVANVSRALWNKGGDFYASEVRPHVVDSVGLCWRYCNFHHELDPFPRVLPFNPPDTWFPPKVNRERVFLDVTLDKNDIQDVNVHGFSHYLSHPDVHVPIITTLLDWAEIISPAERSAAVKKWRAGRIADAPLKKAQQSLGGYVSSLKGDWTQFVGVFNDFRAMVIKNGLDPREGES
jgi:hypothetical protein